MFNAIKKIKTWNDVLEATHLDDIIYKKQREQVIYFIESI